MPSPLKVAFPFAMVCQERDSFALITKWSKISRSLEHTVAKLFFWSHLRFDLCAVFLEGQLAIERVLQMHGVEIFGFVEDI